MSYLPLSNASPDLTRVARVMSRLERHYLRPAHMLFRLPLPNYKIQADFHFNIAQTLLTAIAGASRTLYPIVGGDNRRFKRLLTDFYPWADDEGNRVVPADGARILYELFRCPIVHDLGLNVHDVSGPRTKVLRSLKHRKTAGIPWHHLEILATANRRLIKKLEYFPTLTVRTDATVLMVEALYCGTRVMLEHLSADRAKMEAAEAFLAAHM